MKPDLGMTASQFAVVVIAAELARIRKENPLHGAVSLLFGSDTDTAVAVVKALAAQGLYVGTAIAAIKAMEAQEGLPDARDGFGVVQGRKTWVRPAETPSEAVDGPTGGTDS